MTSYFEISQESVEELRNNEGRIEFNPLALVHHGSSLRRGDDVRFSSLAKLNVIAGDGKVQAAGQPRMRFSLKQNARRPIQSVPCLRSICGSSFWPGLSLSITAVTPFTLLTVSGRWKLQYFSVPRRLPPRHYKNIIARSLNLGCGRLCLDTEELYCKS